MMTSDKYSKNIVFIFDETRLHTNNYITSVMDLMRAKDIVLVVSPYGRLITFITYPLVMTMWT